MKGPDPPTPLKKKKKKKKETMPCFPINSIGHSFDNRNKKERLEHTLRSVYITYYQIFIHLFCSYQHFMQVFLYTTGADNLSYCFPHLDVALMQTPSAWILIHFNVTALISIQQHF